MVMQRRIRINKEEEKAIAVPPNKNLVTPPKLFPGERYVCSITHAPWRINSGSLYNSYHLILGYIDGVYMQWRQANSWIHHRSEGKTELRGMNAYKLPDEMDALFLRDFLVEGQGAGEEWWLRKHTSMEIAGLHYISAANGSVELLSDGDEALVVAVRYEYFIAE